MTSPRFLLDSNICIYILRDALSSAALRTQQCMPGEVVTSAIVYAEVMLGIDRSSEAALRPVDRFFELVAIQPFNQAAANIYARIPFRRGRFDRLIAAHALALDLTIVTANEADFADISGLRTEDWTRA